MSGIPKPKLWELVVPVGLFIWFHISPADTIGEHFGLKSDDPDKVEWTDDYLPPVMECHLEPLGLSLEESRSLQQHHIPRECHKKIAEELFANINSTSDYERALYHYLYSGNNVRKWSWYPFYKEEWVPYIKADADRTSYDRVVAELKANQKLVYGGSTLMGAEIFILERSYSDLHGNRTKDDKVMFPLMMLGFFSWILAWFRFYYLSQK